MPGTNIRVSPTRRLAAFATLVGLGQVVVFLMPIGGQLTPFALVVIPAAAAIAVSAGTTGPAGVQELVARLAVWRVEPKWYAAAVLVPLGEKLLVDAAGLLLGQTTPQRLVSALTIAAVAVPLVVLIPALLEELGWRGYAVQTALDGGRSSAWAAFVVGGLFFAFHVPLYLPGHLFHGLPFWPLPFTLLSSALLLTWMYVRTRSVLLTGLMHASFNATVPLTWGLDPAWVWPARAVVLTVLAAALLLSGRLRARHRPPVRIHDEAARP